jgi:hypothetical protein
MLIKTMEHNKKRWEKSQTADGITKRICVEQVENGYVISVEKYGQSGESEKYTNECKKYISKKNPLEGSEPKTEEESHEEKVLEGLEKLNDLMF